MYYNDFYIGREPISSTSVIYVLNDDFSPSPFINTATVRWTIQVFRYTNNSALYKIKDNFSQG